MNRFQDKVLTVYLRDRSVMHKMKERAAQDDRTLSSWAYHVLRNAAIGNDENNDKQKRSLVGAKVTSHKHQQPEPEEPSPGVTEL